MPSGVYRLRNSKKAPKSMKGIHDVIPVQDTSGYNDLLYNDDSTLRKDVHTNPWSPDGHNPNSPYPVIKGQGYHREKTSTPKRKEEPIRMPKHPDTRVWQAAELDIPTKPPLSNEEPIRGEGPPATHKRGRKGGS